MPSASQSVAEHRTELAQRTRPPRQLPVTPSTVGALLHCGGALLLRLPREEDEVGGGSAHAHPGVRQDGRHLR
eukprot:CAMPEP_0175212824 /NCGR_PEP_ID=MMETSP0093-20121207/15874_1 /TAXON_ID=311494 /ORGANISM="Alexandrium monilatum, Strain CCMP3105" /LENGTH=72 /DNA_ID=CAMNT_0016506125 /DNA_START=59 /DNA_END=273 /DNA_ORIENTATION=-